MIFSFLSLKTAYRNVALISGLLFISLQHSAVASTNFKPGYLLVKPKAGAEMDAELYHALTGNTVMQTFEHAGGAQLVKVLPGSDTIEMCIELEKTEQFEYVELDHVARAGVSANDTSYSDGTLWGLHNTGQDGGKFDADIDAPEGWETRKNASSVVVAVLDSGIRYSHEDLRDNLWVNPGEIAGNGIDDDGNGFVDDIYGINSVNDSGDPWDDLGHGTHVSGTIGANGNNGRGITGVAWDVQIMTLKFLDESDYGSYSDAIQSINYAIAHGADIINNSWAGTSRSAALEDAVRATEEAGILFVSSASNSSNDISENPEYPAAFKFSNTIAVAATDRWDELASYSNYSRELVELAAPGSDIYSSYYYDDQDYVSFNGTSMSAPHVSGALALLKAEFPFDTAQGLIARLLTSTDKLASLEGLVQNAGRLNLDKALKIRNGVRYAKAPPKQYSANGKPLDVEVFYVADQDSEIRVELFDENWNWIAGPKVDVSAGSGRLALQVAVPEWVSLGSGYRWKMDLRPAGTGWQSAVADEYIFDVEVLVAKLADSIEINAWEYDDSKGVESWVGGVGSYNQNDWVSFKNINLPGAYKTVEVTLASPQAGEMDLHLESGFGNQIARIPYTATGGWGEYQTFKIGITSTQDWGVQDLFFRMNKGTANVKSFRISQDAPQPLALNAWEYDTSSGVQSWTGGVGYFDKQDYIGFSNLDMNQGYRKVTVNLSTAMNYRFEVHSSSQYGRKIGVLAGGSTGGWGVAKDVVFYLDVENFLYSKGLFFVNQQGAANIHSITIE